MAEALSLNIVFGSRQRGCWGWGFGTSKGKKAIHGVINSKCLVNTRFLGPQGQETEKTLVSGPDVSVPHLPYSLQRLVTALFRAWALHLGS